MDGCWNSDQKNRRFINITAIEKSLGPQICRALPTFHAYTGSDYTSAFVKKGKIRPFLKLQKSTEVQKAFHDLTEDAENQNAHNLLFKYTASLYGAKEKATLNVHRYKCFEKVYKPKLTSKNPLDKLKGIDASGLPPCEVEVVCHLKRVAFVAKMWANADRAYLEQHPSEANGWTLEDGVYTPVWFQGPQLPEILVPEDNEIEDITSDENEDVDRCEAASSDEEIDIDDDELDNYSVEPF